MCMGMCSVAFMSGWTTLALLFTGRVMEVAGDRQDHHGAAQTGKWFAQCFLAAPYDHMSVEGLSLFL